MKRYEYRFILQHGWIFEHITLSQGKKYHKITFGMNSFMWKSRKGKYTEIESRLMISSSSGERAMGNDW